MKKSIIEKLKETTEHIGMDVFLEDGCLDDADELHMLYTVEEENSQLRLCHTRVTEVEEIDQILDIAVSNIRCIFLKNGVDGIFASSDLN